jgi:hypothetical protein
LRNVKKGRINRQVAKDTKRRERESRRGSTAKSPRTPREERKQEPARGGASFLSLFIISSLRVLRG